MSKSNIKYFKIERNSGDEYIASENSALVEKSLGSLNDPKSIASLFDYDLNSLKEVPKDEAFKYSDFDHDREYNLCSDGTFILGFRKGNLN